MSDVEIGELAVDLAAVTTPSRLAALEREVAASVTARFAEELSALTDAAGAHDGAEVFIDTLDVDCSVASSWDRVKVARTLAARVHDEIGIVTRSGACVAFRDRAEFIAALVLALTDGQAGRHWWFDDFDGLALVPASNAVRTVLLDEGEAGIAALARLTTADARRVVGALRTADAARILDRIALRADCASPDAAVLWQHSRGASGEDPNAWLLALVAAERDEPRSAGPAGLALLRSFQSLRAIAPARLPTIAENSGNGILDELQLLGVDIGGLGTIDTSIIVAICRSASEADGCREEAQPAATAAAHTPHGGAFLLRVILDRTDWRERWARSVQEFDAVTEDTVAWMIVTEALSKGDDSLVRNDIAVRMLLPPGADARIDSLRMDDAIAEEAKAVLRAFARRLPGCDEASVEWLRANLLSFDARVVADAGSVHATIGRPPLDVLLVLAGWKRAQCRLARGLVLTLREVPP